MEYSLEDYEEQLAKAVNGFIEQSGFADYPLIPEGSISVDHEAGS